MSSDSIRTDRPLPAGDRRLYPGWELVGFLMSLGADEFSVRLLMTGDEEEKRACDHLVERLARFSHGKKKVEYTARYRGESDLFEVWRLESASLDVLRTEVMPRGVMGSDWTLPAFGEDLCVYRGGELIFGSVTHEHEAFLRLSDDEWQRFERWSATTFPSEQTQDRAT